MKPQRLEELLSAWESGTLNDAELVELKAQLAAEPAARRRLVESGVLNSVAKSRTKAWQTIPPARAASPGMMRNAGVLTWVLGRPIAAAVAGLVFGMLCTSVVWAYVVPYTGQRRAVMYEGFEKGVAETAPGLPSKPGVWTGDLARVVAAENGVTPKKGDRMLRFVSATHAGENARHSVWSDVYRLVDVRKLIGDEGATLRLSASFAAVASGSEEEYSGSLELCALDEDPGDSTQLLTLPWVRESSASNVLRKMPLKGDGRWKACAVELPVTRETKYVLVHLAVFQRKPYPPSAPVQFSGHYIDDMNLLISRPAAF